MKLIRPLLFFCLFCLTCSLNAQDLHWTLFNHSPLTINPAFTGAYEGSFRVGGIARDQAPNLSHNQFAGTPDPNVFLSYNFYVDAPIITGFRKRDWVGIGVSFYSDEAGSLALGQDYFQGSIAYHIGLDKKQKSVFTIGLHGGQGNRGFDTQRQVVLAGDLFGGTSGFTPPSENSKHFELGAGLLFRSQVNKTTGFNIGLSFKHIVPAGQGAYNIIDTLNSTLPLSLAFHSQLDVKMNKKWSITPAFAVQNAGPATTAQLQGMLGYLFNPKKAVMLNFGLGYRFGDAAQLLLGMDYGAFRVAASFDLTLSSLAAVNNRIGGFELGVSYIGRIYKDPAVKPVIFCPRF